MSSQSLSCWSAFLSALTLLVIAGCNSGMTPVTPAATATAPAAGFAAVSDSGAMESLAAGFDVVIDRANLTATLTPWRRGENFQANVYDLDIDQFQNADSFRVLGIRIDADGNPIMDYSHAHPFPPPNLALPVTSLNRADLGYTGRVLFISNLSAAQLPANTYFTDVKANTSVVVDADGYVNLGTTDLVLSAQGYNTNTFPYKLMVDELRNNRTGVTNGGIVTGNYNAATGGWQAGNIGPTNRGWTGYDYLHEGQEARGFVTISKDAFQGNYATFSVGLLIRYCDPRGNKTKTNRFPQTPVDVLKFAYRMPYGALDCGKVSPGGITLTTATGSNAAINIKIRDWDARGVETTLADLGLDADVSRIQNNGGGSPAVTIDVPSLSATTFTATEGTPAKSGKAGDEIEFNTTLTNSKGTVAPGKVTGMVRVIDPESTDPNAGTYHFGVDAGTLVGSPARALAVVTYQAVRVTVNAPAGSEPQCGATHINGSGSLPPGGTFTVDCSSITDSNSTNVGLQFSYSGPSTSMSSIVTVPVASLGSENALNPFTDSRLTTKLFPPTDEGSYTLLVILTDGTTPPVLCGPYLFSVSPNFPPSCGQGLLLNKSVFFTGQGVDFLANLSNLVDPGNTGNIDLTFSYDGPASDTSSTLSRGFPLPANFDPFGDPGLADPLTPPTAVGTYTFTVSMDDGINNPVECDVPFEVRFGPACGVANSASDITGAPVFGSQHDLNTAPITWYNFYTTQDYATFRDGTAGYLCQRFDTDDDPGNGTQINYQLYRFTAAGDSATAQPMTSFLTAGNQIMQVEVDSTNRVFYAVRPYDDAWGPDTIYTNPNRKVHWFDWDGSLATAETGSVDLPAPVIALTIDADDSFWAIDQNNILLHYTRSGGSYAQAASDQVDLGVRLGIGLSTVICDLVLDFHNGAKYILTNSGPSRNGRLYRLECDGSLWTGGTNPANFALSTGSQYPGVPDGGDLDIDQYSNAGALLTGDQDAQLVVFHAVGGGGLYVFNADLEQTASSTGGTASGARGVVVAAGNYAVSNETGDLVNGEAWAFQDFWTLPGAWK
ncbi:MAG: hypothetical protein ABI743_06345 [bacterium]